MLLPLTRGVTLSKLSSIMSTVTVSPAMAILDKLIDHVTNLPATTTSSSSHASTASSSSSPSSSSYLPSHTTDIAWRPIIPIGHTKYTWVGDDDAPASTATASATSSAAAPPASTLTNSAIPKPDSAAAASASLPVPHVAKPAPKEKKAAQPAAKGGKKEEEKKTDQPDISRIDIRVGQIVRAWRHPEGQFASSTYIYARE